MSDRLDALLADAKARWMIGVPAASSDVPSLAGADPSEVDLRLLVIAGQHRLVHGRPRAPELATWPELPDLPLPFLDQEVRSLVRRALARRSEARHGTAVAALVARRGRAIHPLDWMPAANPSGLPSVYHGLWLWAHHPGAMLPERSFESWAGVPAALRPALVEERMATSSAEGRAILRDVVASCAAEERLQHLKLLAREPGPEDIDLLVRLREDRSVKVKALATRILSRLGQIEAPSEAAREAAEFFEIRKSGLLRRKTDIAIKAKLTPVHQGTLQARLAETSLQELASALGVTPWEFCAWWNPDTCPPHVLVPLAELVAESGRGDDVAAFWERCASETSSFALLGVLLPRMTEAQASAALAKTFDAAGSSGPSLLRKVYGLDLPPSLLDVLLRSSVVRDAPDLAARLARPESTAAEGKRVGAILDAALEELGFLLPSPEAQLLLDRLHATGLHPLDPRLAILALNASLKD